MRFLPAISYISKTSCLADIFWWTQGPPIQCSLTGPWLHLLVQP
jgi:hypothetical protein